MEWRFGDIRVRWIICCGNMSFWHLVIGAAGIIVTGIWGQSESWKCQTWRQWTDTQWNNKYGGADAEFWESDQVLMEPLQLPELNRHIWKISKGQVMYISRKKHPMHPKVWRGQVVRVLHRKSGRATNGAQNIILMTRMKEKLTLIKLNIWAPRIVSR